MAATKRNPMHIEQARSAIRTTQLINRLQNHVDGKIELSATQISAANILLKKSLPDLTAVEHSGEVEHAYAARLPTAAKTMDEWQTSHADQLNPKTLQ